MPALRFSPAVRGLRWPALWLAFCLGLGAGPGMVAAADGPAWSRAKALEMLALPDAELRLAALARLADIGTPADADRVLDRLADIDPRVRAAASEAAWQVWSRSGDPAIDRLYARGVGQMRDGDLRSALVTFSDIVRRRPAFAEGWNKRATIHFLLGDNASSLRDCDEVFRRNPRHFGALSGAGQIHLQMGQLRQALDYFRRAVAVNPNLDGPAEMIPAIEDRLRQSGRDTI